MHNHWNVYEYVDEEACLCVKFCVAVLFCYFEFSVFDKSLYGNNFALCYHNHFEWQHNDGIMKYIFAVTFCLSLMLPTKNFFRANRIFCRDVIVFL